jgi:hypothetical protein
MQEFRDQSDRPEVVDDIATQRAGAACPSAQTAQGIEPPVDRGGAPFGGDHVLGVGDCLPSPTLFDDPAAVADMARATPRCWRSGKHPRPANDEGGGESAV